MKIYYSCSSLCLAFLLGLSLACISPALWAGDASKTFNAFETKVKACTRVTEKGTTICNLDFFAKEPVIEKILLDLNECKAKKGFLISQNCKDRVYKAIAALPPPPDASAASSANTTPPISSATSAADQPAVDRQLPKISASAFAETTKKSVDPLPASENSITILNFTLSLTSILIFTVGFLAGALLIFCIKIFFSNKKTEKPIYSNLKEEVIVDNYLEKKEKNIGLILTKIASLESSIAVMGNCINQLQNSNLLLLEKCSSKIISNSNQVDPYQNNRPAVKMNDTIPIANTQNPPVRPESVASPVALESRLTQHLQIFLKMEPQFTSGNFIRKFLDSLPEKIKSHYQEVGLDVIFIDELGTKNISDYTLIAFYVKNKGAKDVYYVYPNPYLTKSLYYNAWFENSATENFPVVARICAHGRVDNGKLGVISKGELI